jgi:hypothetical protein
MQRTTSTQASSSAVSANSASFTFSQNRTVARANSNGFSRNENNPQKKRKLQQMQENNDVYLVLEESLIDKSFQDALSTEFYNHESPAEFDANQEIAKFPYIPMTTPLAGLIQWIRSESLPDNLVLYESIISFLLPVTAVIVPNEEFLQKVIATTDGIDFPTLDEYIRKYFTKVNQFSGEIEDMKFIFIFLDLGKEINKLQRKVRCSSILFHVIFTTVSSRLSIFRLQIDPFLYFLIKPMYI